MTAIRAHGDRVLVRRIAPAEATAGGIVIPEDMREELAAERGLAGLAVVVSAGRKAVDVKPGDKVLLHFLAGARSEIAHAGEPLSFVHHRDILGVFEP